MTLKRILLSAVLTAPTLAAADINIKFFEGAPTDRFEITNSSTCMVDELAMTINLAGSAGKLIFDTTATGAGVEVFQPMRITAGNDYLAEVSAVTDGDQTVTLTINSFDARGVISFTADLDDQLDQSDLGQIRVTNGEIEGAAVIATAPQEQVQATFGPDAAANIKLAACST
ncbi:MAG: aggregation factor core [Pikeienuella sp.]